MKTKKKQGTHAQCFQRNKKRKKTTTERSSHCQQF